MTDSFDSKASKSSRKKPRREPATIDLEATVLDDGQHAEQAPDEVERLVTEAMAESEASLDSGPGKDSIEAKPESDTIDAKPAASNPPPPPPPPPAEPPRRTSPGPLIGAGLLGGLVGAGLVYGLQSWRTPVQDDQRLTRIEQRISALGQPANTQALDSRIKALEEARASVDQRLQTAQGAAEQAAARADEAMNRPVPQTSAPQNDAALKDLSDRLAALEGQVRTQTRGTQQSAESAQALQQSVQNLDSRVAENDQRLATLSQEVAKGPDDTTLAAIRISLTERLNDALRQGVPYADVLAALRKIESDSGRLAPLEPFAQQGAPTAAELSQSFKSLSAAILRDDRAAAGGWTDRFWRMADRIVTIRPVNEPGSTGVPGLVARIDQALERGNVPEAVAAWAALPEPSRRITEEWGRKAKARAEADVAAQALAKDALAALNRPAQQ
ncbi:COG4223 family protein [Microvirga sp. 2TAF3]|uniref:COG4223 family protein n=1 Tax=Microvirga sp. 2TAF3 TaxID=3233014 RepID=UPI003F9DD12C